MKIKSIVLTNFMNHVNSKIDLSNNLTCVTGNNDNGKSVIFYALRWFVNNEPKGGAIITSLPGVKATKCSVELIMEDGTNFIKTRSVKGGTTFEAPKWKKSWGKTDIPKEIANIIGIKTNLFGTAELELNFSFQLDAPFLISENPSTGAAVIAAFSGTDVIDLVCKDLSKEMSRLKIESNKFANEVKLIEEVITTYGFLEGSELKVGKAIIDVQSVSRSIVLADTLKEIMGVYEKAVAVIEPLVYQLGLLNKLNTVDGNNKVQLLGKTVAVLARAKTLLEAFTEISSRLQNCALVLDILKSCPATYSIDEVAQYTKVMVTLKKLSKTYDLYSASIKQKQQVLKATKAVPELTTKRVTQKKLVLSSLSKLADNFNAVQTAISNLRMKEHALKTVQDVKNSLHSFNYAVEANESLKKLKQDYDSVENSVRDIGNKLTMIASKYNGKQAELNLLWEEVKECPLCGTILKKGENHEDHN